MAQTELDRSASDAAWRRFRAGDWRGALDAFEQLLRAAPDDLQLRLRYGRALAERRDPRAEAELRRILVIKPNAPGVLCLLAEVLRLERRLDEAVACLDAALNAAPEHVPALVALADLKAQQKRHSDAYALYGRAMKLAPDDADIPVRFSRALNAHALRLAERAAELDPGLTAADLARAAALRGEGRLDEAQDLLQARLADGGDASVERELGVLRGLKGEGAMRRRPAVWPRLARQFENLEKVVRDYVLTGSRPPRPILGPASKVVALGSCFAEHIAASLREQGVDVFFNKRSETLDNLYATNAFLDWAGEGASADRALHAEKFRSADVVILSLGVAAAYFDRASGAFVQPGEAGRDKAMLAAACEFRMLSLQENAGQLRKAIAAFKAFNPAVQVVLTVSPIPLAATFERPSAVLADAVSKSTMRLTVEEVLKDDCVFYWPSFEIVRWLGAHLPPGGPAVFGADDGSSRHVSIWLVRMIIRLFLEAYGEGFSPSSCAAAPPQAQA